MNGVHVSKRYCPRCQDEGGAVILGRDLWAVCQRDRVKWYVTQMEEPDPDPQGSDIEIEAALALFLTVERAPA